MTLRLVQCRREYLSKISLFFFHMVILLKGRNQVTNIKPKKLNIMAQHWPKHETGQREVQSQKKNVRRDTHVTPNKNVSKPSTARHDTRQKENHAGDWTAFHRTSPETERRLTGSHLEKALTQTHHFISFACYHQRASDEKSRSHPETKPPFKRLNHSLTLHTPLSLDFRSSESINRTNRDLIRHIKPSKHEIKLSHHSRTHRQNRHRRKDRTTRKQNRQKKC